MTDMDTPVNQKVIEVVTTSTKRCVLWLAKFIGVIMAGGIVVQVLYIPQEFFPSLSILFTILQLIVALATFGALDALIPLWFKQHIPVIRVGAANRAETYAKWYAWYSMR